LQRKKKCPIQPGLSYASILSEEEAASEKYFLAHRGAYKGLKFRVVFDAAASFQEKCLTMLSDPALKPSLQSLLIQFREGEIAFASNVEP
jgi:hypothetical protein